MNLPGRVLDFILRGGLLRGGEHVLAAVSGGADSVAMLHLLSDLAPQLGIRLSVAHLNHRLRGREAARDARFVEQLAKSLGMPFMGSSCEVRKLARERNVSVEMAARMARYKFLAEAREKLGADCVAVAHNSDDQVETVLLKLARGSVAGLGGMKAVTAWGGLRVIRPLLGTPRPEIMRYLKGRRLEWVEDSSNAGRKHLRNRVRHEVIPLIEKELNPQFRKVVLQTAGIVAEDQEWLDELSVALLKKCSVGEGLSMQKLNRLHPAARRRVLMLWLQPCGDVTFELLKRIEVVLAGEKGSQWVPGPGGLRVGRRYDLLVLETAREGKGFNRPVKIPGATALKKQYLVVTAERCRTLSRQAGGKIGEYPAWACVNASVLKGRGLRVRSWRAGDRFAPLGIAGTKKIQDIFVDAKIPQALRGDIPLFAAGDEIIWIPGYRVARSAAVTDPSKGVILLRVERGNS
ncbi:MAG TPA: tRNA lysidine(34) synthetase TilS [Kiritimatiellia bacterium]|nr:tRNA lysidine(34) synthetase TilS [Kiritimatiellia bacterium]